jgi:hypothetical protein
MDNPNALDILYPVDHAFNPTNLEAKTKNHVDDYTYISSEQWEEMLVLGIDDPKRL